MVVIMEAGFHKYNPLFPSDENCYIIPNISFSTPHCLSQINNFNYYCPLLQELRWKLCGLMQSFSQAIWHCFIHGGGD